MITEVVKSITFSNNINLQNLDNDVKLLGGGDILFVFVPDKNKMMMISFTSSRIIADHITKLFYMNKLIIVRTSIFRIYSSGNIEYTGNSGCFETIFQML